MPNDESQTLLCAEKLAFDTKNQATGSATAIKHQRGIKLKAYKCRYCALWHLSSHVITADE